MGFSKATNNTRPSNSCYFEVFEKLTRACFFPNWTRIHDITYTNRHRSHLLKVPMQRNFQVGDNNIKVMFDIASLDCESLRTNNEIEVCLFSV